MNNKSNLKQLLLLLPLTFPFVFLFTQDYKLRIFICIILFTISSIVAVYFHPSKK